MHSYLLGVLRDLDTQWSAWFDDNGLGEPVVYYTLIPPGRTHSSHCRDPHTSHRITVEHDHPNAYYCPVDPYDPDDPANPRHAGDSDNGMIILPVTTLQHLWSAGSTTGSAGEFAVALVLAHEFGHHVQHELALHWFEASSNPVPVFTGANRELIADCLAGTWLSTRYLPEALGSAAVHGAFAAVAAMGVAQSATGYGSGQERRDAFLLGAAGGRPGDCIAAYWG
ncbi:neutral zinc metallopeptidase [Arthrobacter sp. TmT3-37]